MEQRDGLICHLKRQTDRRWFAAIAEEGMIAVAADQGMRFPFLRIFLYLMTAETVSSGRNMYISDNITKKQAHFLL